MFIYLLCHLHFGIAYSGLNTMSTVVHSMESYFQTLYWTFWGRCSTTVLEKGSVVLEQLQNKPLEHS